MRFGFTFWSRHILIYGIALAALSAAWCGPDPQVQRDLLTAAQGGDVYAAEHCIAAGADVNADVRGITPLDAAIEGNQAGMVRHLISKGARPTLHAAAAIGDDVLIRKLLREGADVNARNHYGDTPLLVAAEHCRPSSVAPLMENGADPTAENSSNCPAIHLAAEKGYIEVIEALLAHGVKVDARDSDGTTPLMVAAIGSKEAAIYLLDKGADVNAADRDGWTALDNAVFVRNRDLAEVLLKRGANPNQSGTNGLTAMHLATNRRDEQALGLLLAYGGKEDLYTAAGFGQMDEVKKMVAAHVDVNKPLCKGRTALHAAAFNGRLNIVYYLVSHGARADIRDDAGVTPADLAAARNHSLIAAYLRNPKIYTLGFFFVVALLIVIPLLLYGLWRLRRRSSNRAQEVSA